MAESYSGDPFSGRDPNLFFSPNRSFPPMDYNAMKELLPDHLLWDKYLPVGVEGLLKSLRKTPRPPIQMQGSPVEPSVPLPNTDAFGNQDTSDTVRAILEYLGMNKPNAY